MYSLRGSETTEATPFLSPERPRGPSPPPAYVVSWLPPLFLEPLFSRRDLPSPSSGFFGPPPRSAGWYEIVRLGSAQRAAGLPACTSSSGSTFESARLHSHRAETFGSVSTISRSPSPGYWGGKVIKGIEVDGRWLHSHQHLALGVRFRDSNQESIPYSGMEWSNDLTNSDPFIVSQKCFVNRKKDIIRDLSRKQDLSRIRNRRGESFASRRPYRNLILCLPN